MPELSTTHTHRLRAQLKDKIHLLTSEQQNALLLIVVNIERQDCGLYDGLVAYFQKLAGRLKGQSQDVTRIAEVQLDQVTAMTAGIPKDEAALWIAALTACFDRRDREMWDDAVRLIEVRTAA